MKKTLIIACCALAAVSGFSMAATYQWTGNGDGSSWTDAGNWSESGVPPTTLGAGNSIIINSDASISTAGAGNLNYKGIDQLVLKGTGTLSNNTGGALILGNVEMDKSFTLSSGNTQLWGNLAIDSVINSGALGGGLSEGYVWDFGLNGRLATTSLWINANGGTIQAAIDPYTTTGAFGTVVRELLGQNASSSSGGNGFDTVDYVVRDAEGNILTRADGPLEATAENVGKYWITTNGGAWANVKIHYITGAAPVPEPAAAGLSAAGLLLALLRRRRMR
ncbi:PEP-CTERM sorting domain-containing protein [Akkermansia muciniphila]|uniref:PEP-CTERM sorting domain-containing protein n=1 Tax=Akkermansia muciniphila TaxID=239935 RepID=UPI001BFF9C35|nr:PEP-CTERM sorting domain-containing protein [Akkermansia muciniphila]MBT8779016.1 PEP-CTERM sorting domain-containing protein [Akkermansia muciniphila]